MSFSYISPKASHKDYGRFIIGDTVDSGHLLEDEEINYLVQECTVDAVFDITLFKARITRVATTKMAMKTGSRKLGPQSEDNRDRLKYFEDEANKAEVLSNFSGTPPLPEYESEKVFKNKQKIFEVIFSYKMQNFTIFKDYLLLIRNYFKKLIFLVKVNSKIISV